MTPYVVYIFFRIIYFFFWIIKGGFLGLTDLFLLIIIIKIFSTQDYDQPIIMRISFSFDGPFWFSLLREGGVSDYEDDIPAS